MTEHQNTPEVTKALHKTNDKLPYIIIIILLIIISVLSFFVGKKYDVIFNNSLTSTNTGNTLAVNPEASNIELTIIDDKRCTDCPTKAITDQLKQLPFLSGVKIEEKDFKDEWVEEFMKANDIQLLPAFLFNSNQMSDQQFTQYLQATPSWLFTLNIGAEYDPYGEICDNGVDDNNDSKIDCQDTSCSKALSCAPKVERPVADLYIMSYCPYGLQAQKGYLEVMSKLSKVADINVKWVPYVMHGQKEADENIVQYCIQKEQKDTYIKYLHCFLAEEGKWQACRKESGVNETKLTTCIDETKKTYKVDEKMADTSKQYPDFDIDKEAAVAAGVQWSPTFVLNGIKIDKIGRNGKAYADAICSSFKEKPKECDETFQDINFDPMFGFTSNGSNVNSWCAAN